MSVAQSLSSHLVPRGLRRAEPDAVVLMVVFASGVPIGEIRGIGRMPQVLAARWAMAYLLRTLSRLSWPEVADRVRPHGTGHSSVIRMPEMIELARQEAGADEARGSDRNRQARRQALEIVGKVEGQVREMMAGGAA